MAAKGKKDINFLPSRLQAARQRKKKLLLWGLVIIVFCGGLYSLYSYPQRLISRYQEQLARQEATVASLRSGEAIYQRLQAKQAQYDAMIQVLREIEQQHFAVGDLLNDISRALPRGVWVTRLVLSPSRVTITVESSHPIDTARVIVALRRMDKVKEVNIPPTLPLTEAPKEITFELVLRDNPEGMVSSGATTGGASRAATGSDNSTFKELLSRFVSKLLTPQEGNQSDIFKNKNTSGQN